MTDTRTARAITEAELRGIIAQLRADPRATRLLVVDTAPDWDGPEVLEDQHGQIRVVPGPSVLAVRSALVDHPDETLVLLTPLAPAELGREVMARAWRGAKRSPSAWDSVQALFKADGLDPMLRKKPWMVQLLVGAAPVGGYPAALGSVLTAEAAAKVLHTHVLGLATGTPAAADLLQWVSDGTAARSLADLDDAVAAGIAQHLSDRVTPAAGALVHLARRGHGADAGPLGLVLDGLGTEIDEGPKVRLEVRHFDDELPDAQARTAWARTTVDMASRLPADAVSHLIDRAEDILRDLRVDRVNSTLLPTGLRTATTDAVAALTAALDDATAIGAAAAAVADVATHTAAPPRRVRTLTAALRLARRRADTPDVSPDTLEGAVDTYERDGAWLDAVRHDLAVGDTDEEVAGLADSLLAALDDQRKERDQRFAATFAAQGCATAAPAEQGASTPLRIEQVLDTVVTPLAAHGPVLLLVIDGLSLAASVPVLNDLRDEGWRSVAPHGRSFRPVLAAAPTVTVVSRASLLTGTLTTGGQDVEREGFTHHSGLNASSDKPPVLFHKKDLRSVDGLVAPTVLHALADPDQQVVGVVFNGVDDFLGGGDQLELREGLDGLPLLRPLLAAAVQGERRVVLTSDHGHVLGSTRVIAAPGGGERFRLVDAGPPADGEVALEGPRVLRGDGSIVAAADGEIRYNAVRKHGYHGGATPAEALCPLHVLVAANDVPDGWAPVAMRTPDWWTGRTEVIVDTAAPAATVAPKTEPTAAPTLFDEPAPELDWIEQLLSSDRLDSQRQLVGRAAADDQTIRSVLRVLDANDGTASAALLQRHLDVPTSRLRGKVQAVRAVLDIDGYNVLTVEQDGSASLNRELLATQFEVDVPGTRRG